MIWNELSIPMTNKSKTKNNIATLSDDPGDKDLPDFMQRTTQQMTKGLCANRYDKHNYVDMVKKCKHLDDGQQSTLLKLFLKYKALFSGTLGRVPGALVKLKLKKTHPHSMGEPIQFPRYL